MSQNILYDVSQNIYDDAILAQKPHFHKHSVRMETIPSTLRDTHLEQGSDAWKDARYACVTCTDIGKILGLDTGCTRQKLLASKRRKSEVMEHCNPYVQSLLDNGRRFEETCRESWKSWYINHGNANAGFVPSMHVDTDLPFFSGSPDYIVPSDGVVVECKVCAGQFLNSTYLPIDALLSQHHRRVASAES